MKKTLLLIILLASLSTLKAQINDGMNQGAKYRFWVPITVSLDEPTPNVSPFFSYKFDVTKWFNVAARLDYQINTENFGTQVWMCFMIKEKLFLLSRSVFDINNLVYRHSFATTLKLPYGFMLDTTWDNVLNDSQFCVDDRFQVVGGIAYSFFVFNMGYSMLDYPGFVTNLRIKFDKYQWIQLKYDGGKNSVTASLTLQFD